MYYVHINIYIYLVNFVPFWWNKEEEGRPLIVKRKLHGTVDRSSANGKFVNWMRLYITCEKSRGLHLVEPGLMAGRQAGWQNLGKA